MRRLVPAIAPFASIVLLAPGLSVIIDAIKESRKIFQRMNSYAMYRIAETLRVLLFMTFAILVFNFYPVTAVMIVMLMARARYCSAIAHLRRPSCSGPTIAALCSRLR